MFGCGLVGGVCSEEMGGYRGLFRPLGSGGLRAGLGMRGLEFRIRGLGFRVQGLGFRVRVGGSGASGFRHLGGLERAWGLHGVQQLKVRHSRRLIWEGSKIAGFKVWGLRVKIQNIQKYTKI